MKLSPIKLTAKQLDNNNKYWLSKLDASIKPPTEIVNLFCNTLFTTHSFPYEKKTPKGDVIPYESIFSEATNNGVLSNGYRKKVNENPDDDKSSRNIPNGLENYVFAYLGIHQPYYARKQDDKIGVNSKPFGLFVKNPLEDNTIEKFPHNHASRRDVGVTNDEVDQSAKEREFLRPKDARTLMAHQLYADPAHAQTEDIERFWHYYGNLKHWSDRNYAINSWKKKAEFRFFEKLPLSDIKAVLWPIWASEVNDTDITFSGTYEAVKMYSKKLTEITFITYDLDLRKPEICFIEASSIALEYYLKKGQFPSSIKIAKEEL